MGFPFRKALFFFETLMDQSLCLMVQTLINLKWQNDSQHFQNS